VSNLLYQKTIFTMFSPVESDFSTSAQESGLPNEPSILASEASLGETATYAPTLLASGLPDETSFDLPVVTTAEALLVDEMMAVPNALVINNTTPRNSSGNLPGNSPALLDDLLVETEAETAVEADALLLGGLMNSESESQTENRASSPTGLDQASLNSAVGTFVVDSSGQVEIDFLFDGGGYAGELALFSLEGMGSLSKEAFIQEAFQRVLSGSPRGQVVIADTTEAAQFSGELGERDRNQGTPTSTKVLNLAPGSRFALMLIPNGTVAEAATSDQSPLFSIAAFNPNGGTQIAQAAKGVFGIEDLPVNTSDADFNDIIFRLKGATSDIASLEEVINPANNWRTNPIAQPFFAEPQFLKPETPVPPLIEPPTTEPPTIEPPTTEPPTIEPPVAEGPPVVEKPPVSQEPPVSEEPPVVKGPPVSEKPPVPEKPPVIEKKPVPEEPPVSEKPPVPEEPPVIEKNPVPEEPPVAEKPPVPEEPVTPPIEELPVTEGPSSSISNISNSVSKFTPGTSVAELAASGAQRITLGTQTIYIGTQQVTSINQNPIIRSVDPVNPANNWLRTDVETTGTDGRGLGLFWSGSALYGVFSVDGTQGSPSQDFRRATGGAQQNWLKSFGAGGGKKIAVIGEIDPATGDLLRAAHLSAVLSSGATNSLSVNDISLNEAGNLVVSASSFSNPRRPDGSALSRNPGNTASSPFDYTIELTAELSRVVSTSAPGWS